MEVDAASARNLTELALRKNRQDRTKNKWRMELIDVLIFLDVFRWEIFGHDRKKPGKYSKV